MRALDGRRTDVHDDETAAAFDLALGRPVTMRAAR
jgi:hypothetical protein